MLCALGKERTTFQEARDWKNIFCCTYKSAILKKHISRNYDLNDVTMEHGRRHAHLKYIMFLVYRRWQPIAAISGCLSEEH
jgi:hypothetical protein